MRVFLDIEDQGGELFIAVTGPQIRRVENKVAWVGGKRLLVAKSAAGTISGPHAVALAKGIEDGAAGAVADRITQQREYGQFLFEAAFGQPLWQRLLATANASPYLELAIRGVESDDQAAMQALRWEALHDGSAFIAAQGTANGSVSVSIVRLVPFRPDASTPASVSYAATGIAFQPIDRIPRVLFAVGSRLTDPNLQSGAEFMGIMRRLERDGGMVQPKVQDEATPESLRLDLHAFRPDILHLIGHGKLGLDGHVRLKLRPDSALKNGDIDAEQLLGAFHEADHAPTVAILSACETATRHVSSLPFAARLVAGGIPVVIAMAGNIEDTACRIFTRALTGAIGQGIALSEAVIRGRRAAFYKRAYDSADWIMPTIFLAEGVPAGVALVNPRPIDAARKRVRGLRLHLTPQDDPVFCGRREFFPAMDRLLDGDAANVLIAHIPDKDQHYGGSRLLRELGARAVRAGVLPILLGPFEQDPPTSLADLGDELSAVIRETRDTLGLARANGHVAALGVKAKAFQLADAIRADIDQIIADLSPHDPVRSRPSPQPQAVLLCHRVDKWQAALEDLIGMLGPDGLTGSGRPVPVVMTGANVDLLHEITTGKRKIRFSAQFLPLGRLPTENDEDLLAYQWWLLNPPNIDVPAYALLRGASPKWRDRVRLMAELTTDVYPDRYLYKWAEAEDATVLTKDADERLLAAYARVFG